MPVNRLLIVSNRLPVTARVSNDGVRLVPASGGLATGLRPWHERSGSRWIGWPGDLSKLTADQHADLDRRLEQSAIVPVHLTRDQIDRYYHGFANRVLWPLFHYLIDRVPVDAVGWDAYQEVNETFADTVAREYQVGDTIWVHDYQLMLLPSLLRRRVPGARIGMFLHIPFPSSEVFRTLPWRQEILDGLLGADLLGFHTFAYMRHFLASLLHVAGIEGDVDRIRVDDREVKLGVFPMGIDATQFATLAGDEGVRAQAEAIRRHAGNRRILLGVDRLDYTKGLPRRLHAIERLLVRHPDLRDQVRYIQVAVPSRGQVDSYERFKRQVEETVGRINGARGTLHSTPVHYMHQAVSPRELVALYLAADVMLVTPLRDGMNLVAKEFVASRTDNDGVLVLSEFAGAAAELDGAVVVNPYDVEQLASTIHSVLQMPQNERHTRMTSLRRRVVEHDVHAWADSFLRQLAPTATAETSTTPKPNLAQALRAASCDGICHLLLDYDGTLVPLVASPELASPDDEVLELLRALATAPNVRVDIVSGRPRETLDAWLGHLPFAMWAEHGFWHRPSPDAAWTSAASLPPGWMNTIMPMLQQFTDSTPGSQIEIKNASIAWHYRRAERGFGARQAHELRMLLGDALSNQPFEVLEGKKVVEIRLRGISKAAVAHRLLAETPGGTTFVALGDDRTDDDLFGALPPPSVTIAVGPTPTKARFRVDDYRAVRELLATLAAETGVTSRAWSQA